MDTPHTIICKRCGQETPLRTYATKRCPPCEQLFQEERMAPFRSTCAVAASLPIRAVEATQQPVAAVSQEQPPKYKSQTESDYAEHLEIRKRIGEIVRWRYEPVRFRLAEKTTYTIDWMVTMPDGLIEFHETKYSWKDRRNDACRVKVKIVAEMYPEFRFVGMVKDDAGIWQREEF